MRGHLDQSMRPILPIQVNGTDLEVLIDTGFNDTLAVGLDVAAQLRVVQSGQIFFASTAGGNAPYRTGIV